MHTARPQLQPSLRQIRLAKRLRQAVETVESAETHGLNSAHYGLHELRNLVPFTATTALTAQRIRRAEAIAEHHLLALGLDLRYGHTTPDREQIESMRLSIDIALARGDIGDWLKSLLPAHQDYERLRIILRDLEKLRFAGGWNVVGEGPALDVGDAGERVPRLRDRLGIGGIELTPASSVYDEQLSARVRDYQLQHGLDADGIAGSQTIRHLDVDTNTRIEQVKTNLARMRQNPTPTQGTYVHVNVPGFSLDYVRQGKPTLSMRVIVGNKKNPTPVFSDSIEYLVFSPYWNVPRRIAVKELLPIIVNDPDYLGRENFEIISAEGPVHPDTIDWSGVDTGEFPHRLRQKPGGGNSLGQVKFIFPNTYNVYMHDTPADSLFARSRRALSHGCVRLERPQELAAALLADLPEWSNERISAAMQATKPDYVALNQPVPVVITYRTVGVTKDGQVRFFDDIYRRDQRSRGILASSRLPSDPASSVPRLAANSSSR